MDIYEESLAAHEEWGGKIEIQARAEVSTPRELSLAYTPGVARPCLEIQKDEMLSYTLTRRHNTVAVVTDGTAVLGLGDIGAVAGMPVMEGKCLLFKQFGGVDAIPLCIKSKDVDDIVRTVYLLSGSFGGVNLEDISAPRCIEIERRLKELCDIPIFHDDQHGTAIVVLAALSNALKLTGRKIESCRIVINGAGAAGLAIGKLLLSHGAHDLTFVDLHGAIYKGSPFNNPEQEKAAFISNPYMRQGALAEIVKGADIFVGVSKPGLLTADMVRSMAKDSIVFAMANPVPEIMPELASASGAAVVGTGRSDYPNQINNVLAFPGVFRGALDVRASDINEEMKIAAALAIASLVGENDLKSDYIIPSPFDKRVAAAVAAAVAKAAVETGVSRI